MTRSALAALLTLALLAAPAGAGVPDDIHWSDDFDSPTATPPGDGVLGIVNAMVEFEGNLIVAGSLQQAGTVAVERIARRTGSGWEPLGSLGSSVLDLAIWNGSLVVGLNTTSEPVRVWDGSAWNSLATGWPAGCRPGALIDYQGTLYAGLRLLGTGVSNSLWRWNGSSWEEAPSGGTNGFVEALGVYSGELYIGGRFGTAGGIAARNIAAFDGTTYRKLGPGVSSGDVLALREWNGSLIVSGTFRSAGPVVAEGMAAYDGSTWSFVGSALTPNQYYSNMRVQALGTYNGRLIVAGFFDQVQGPGLGLPVAAQNIAAFDGADWAPLGSGVTGGFSVNTNALQESGGSLWVGGSFSAAGDKPAGRISTWTEATTGIGDGTRGLTLSRAMPNPFRSATRIELSLETRTRVRAEVYDVRGRRVRSLVDEPLGPGAAAVSWDGLDDNGTSSAAGVYFLRVTRDEATATRRLVRLP